MKYDRAMAAIQNIKKVVRRQVTPTMTIYVARRFGRDVILTNGPNGGTFIDYTPTQEDMRADDWQISEEIPDPNMPGLDLYYEKKWIE